MRIQKAETYTRGHLSVVRILIDDGAEGFEQIAPSNADISALVFHRQVAPLALGRDPLEIDELVDRVVEGTYKLPGTYVRRALAGLDTALWDLRGKLEGKTVCELLGGHPRPIAAYGSSMRRDITPEDEAARMLRLRDEHGYEPFKLKIGKRNGHDEDEWPGRTEAVVAAVRAALGDSVSLLAIPPPAR